MLRSSASIVSALVLAACAAATAPTAQDAPPPPPAPPQTEAPPQPTTPTAVPAPPGGTITEMLQSDSARAELRDLQGNVVATARIESAANGAIVRLTSTGLPAGEHGFHVHEVGRCEPPFQSAGGHLHTAGTQHGFRNPAGPHAGDMPNIRIPQSGRAEVEFFVPRVSFDAGPTGLFDADGSALVVHAGPDDYRTDPAGTSGDRIACGVIRR